MHVAVKQSVGGTQNSHRLHPRSSFQLTLHGHVGETGQTKVAAFTEISSKKSEAEVKSGLPELKQHCLHSEVDLNGGSQREYAHEITGDPMGTAGHGLKLHSIQVHVMRQAPLYHVPCIVHTNIIMKVCPHVEFHPVELPL